MKKFYILLATALAGAAVLVVSNHFPHKTFSGKHFDNIFSELQSIQIV